MQKVYSVQIVQQLPEPCVVRFEKEKLAPETLWFVFLVAILKNIIRGRLKIILIYSRLTRKSWR